MEEEQVEEMLIKEIEANLIIKITLVFLKKNLHICKYVPTYSLAIYLLPYNSVYNTFTSYLTLIMTACSTCLLYHRIKMKSHLCNLTINPPIVQSACMYIHIHIYM